MDVTAPTSRIDLSGFKMNGCSEEDATAAFVVAILFLPFERESDSNQDVLPCKGFGSISCSAEGNITELESTIGFPVEMRILGADL